MRDDTYSVTPTILSLEDQRGSDLIYVLGRRAICRPVCEQVMEVPDETVKGGAVGDVDFDGQLDMLLSHGEVMVGPLEVYTVDQSQRFLRVMPQTIYNAPARGARVTLVTTNGRGQTRVIDCGSGYLNQMEPVAHFGLKGTSPLQVTIQWPNGQVYSYIVSEADVNTLHKITLSANKVSSDGDRVIKYRYERNQGTRDNNQLVKSANQTPTTHQPKLSNQVRNSVLAKTDKKVNSQTRSSHYVKQHGSSQSAGATDVLPTTTTSFRSRTNSEETIRTPFKDLRVPLVASSYGRMDNKDARGQSAFVTGPSKTTWTANSHNGHQLSSFTGNPIAQVHNRHIKKNFLPSSDKKRPLSVHASRRAQTSPLLNLPIVSTDTERHQRPNIVNRADKTGKRKASNLATNTLDEFSKTRTFPIFRQRPEPTTVRTPADSKAAKVSPPIRHVPYAARTNTDIKTNELQTTNRPTPTVNKILPPEPNARRTIERHNSKWDDAPLTKTLTPFVNVILPARGDIHQQGRGHGNENTGAAGQTFSVPVKGYRGSDQTTRNVNVAGRPVARPIPKMSSTGFRIRWADNERRNPDQRISEQRQYREFRRLLEQKRRHDGYERRVRYRSGTQASENELDTKNTNDNPKVKQSTGIAKSGVRYIFWNRRFKLCKITVTHWQPCSRTCGGGTTTRMSNDNSRCFLRKEHKRCNVESCPRLLNDAGQRAEKSKVASEYQNHKGREVDTSNSRQQHNQRSDDRRHRNNYRVGLQNAHVFRVNNGNHDRINARNKLSSFERSPAKASSPRNDRLLRSSSLRQRSNIQFTNTEKLPTSKRATRRDLPVAKAQNNAVGQIVPHKKHNFLSDDAGTRFDEQHVSTKTQRSSESEVLATSVRRKLPSSLEAGKQVLSKRAKSCSSSKQTRVHFFDCADSAKLETVCCAYEKFRPCEENACPFKVKFLCSRTLSLDHTCLCPRNCK